MSSHRDCCQRFCNVSRDSRRFYLKSLVRKDSQCTVCRSMRLSGSDSRLLHLAGPDLEALNCDEGQFSITQQAWWTIGGFTALTRLKLQNGFLPTYFAASIRMLPLQELVLIDCSQLDFSMFRREAPSSLRRLHIEKNNFDPGYPRIEWKYDLAEYGSVQCRLPNLHQISGTRGRLQQGMQDLLATWHYQPYSNGLMTAHGHESYGLGLWTRPESQ